MFLFKPHKYSSKFNVVFLILFCVFSQSAFSKTDIIFEGYYKILLGQSHVGYTIQQYSYDQKTKQFHTAYYIKTNVVGGGTTEGLKATSTNTFQPISYKYTSQIGQNLSSIDAKFELDKKNKLKQFMTKSDGKSAKPLNKVLPKGTFLSSFQTYLMLQKSFKVGTRFQYSAIAEEDGEVYTGQVYVKEKVDYKGQNVYRILNEFKGAKYVSLMNDKGEVLKTDSVLQNLSTELVETPAEATKGYKLDVSAIKYLFGSLPR
ncbi:MAG: hypothetical protein KDD50_14855, partial [Bdellovibrionales bacterium]|nr:hypothetical protein [Bdellovibrionales bacterium]